VTPPPRRPTSLPPCPAPHPPGGVWWAACCASSVVASSHLVLPNWQQWCWHAHVRLQGRCGARCPPVAVVCLALRTPRLWQWCALHCPRLWWFVSLALLMPPRLWRAWPARAGAVASHAQGADTGGAAAQPPGRVCAVPDDGHRQRRSPHGWHMHAGADAGAAWRLTAGLATGSAACGMARGGGAPAQAAAAAAAAATSMSCCETA